jgi:hypothetical protein
MMRSCRVWLAVVCATLATSVAGRAADVKLLPNDTELVLTINFRQILNSELVKSQKEVLDQVKGFVDNALAGEPDAQRYLKAAGFDLFRDLTSVTLAMPPSKDIESGFIIIEGTFDTEKFHGAAKEAAKEYANIVKINKAGDQKVIEVNSPDGKSAYVAMISKNLVVACAEKKRMTAALARIKGKEKGELKKEIKTLLETTNSKQSVSGVATGQGLSKLLANAPVPKNQGQVLGPALMGIDGLSLALTIGKDVQFQIGVGTKDAETAKDFAQKAGFALLLAQGVVAQKAQEDAKLQPVVDIMKTLQATAQGSSLIIRGQATLENISKLIKNFQPNQ